MSDSPHPPALTPESDAPLGGTRALLSLPGAERVIEAIMFTDIEKSVELQQAVGTERYAEVLTRHGELFYEALGTANAGSVEKHTGDGFMVRFSLASDAVAAALRFQWLLRREQWNMPDRVRVRIGIHQGEILLLQTVRQMPGTVGTPVNLAARVMAMAEGGQILLTRAVFDSARQFIREIPDVPASADVVLGWEAHGAYVVRGMENPVEIFEVGERGRARFTRPASNAAAQRVVSSEEEATLGWRPARAMEVPKRPGWFLQRQIGEGGFGEVWVAENHRTHELRVFKFCFDAVRLRSFKRELALFRLISEALGPRPDIATLYEVQLESAPFFLESEFCPGGTLKDWLERKDAAGGAPLSTRLEIVARVARALAAAHSVGVIHKDVKPTNIFIEERSDGEVRPRLADFGIGTVANVDVVANLNITFSDDLTMVGDLSRTGTRLYSPPEYMVGRPASILGDIYSLGVLLYQVVISDFEQPLGLGWQRNVPDALLADDIASCVDVEPERRFSSALQLAERIESLDQRRAELQAAEADAQKKAEQLRELARHRQRVRIAWASAALASLLLGALSVVLFVEHRRSTEIKSHAAVVEKGRELAQGRLYIADMQAATDDALDRRVGNTRELLKRHIPAPGERDHRGWEWFFADSVLNTSHIARAVSNRPLRAIAVNADQSLAAIAGDDGNISIWSCDTLENQRTWSAGSVAIQSIAWQTSGRLATGLANGEIAIWDPANGSEQSRWKAHEGSVTTMGWHPKQPVLATGGADGLLAWWQPDGKLLDSAKKQGSIQSLDWCPDTLDMAITLGHPAHLLIGSADAIGRAHEVPLGVDESPVAWRPNFPEVATSAKGRLMRSLKITEREDAFYLPSSFTGAASCFAWAPSGEAVAVGCLDGKIILIDPTQHAESRIALYSDDRVAAMQWLGRTRERLLSVGDDGKLRAWDNLYRSPEETTENLAARVTDARWHPKENKIAVVIGGDELQILDGSTRRPIWNRPLPLPVDPHARWSGSRLAWSSDGQRLAVACPGRSLVAWDFKSGTMKAFSGYEDCSDVQWMSDDRRLLYRDSKGWAWTSMDRSEHARIPGTEDAVWVAPLENDRIGVVKRTVGGLCYAHSGITGVEGEATELLTGLASFRCAALSADRSLLAVGGASGAVLWIDTRTGKWHRPGLAHAGPVKAIGWHPGGTRLGTVGADGTCRVFNISQVAQNWVITHKLDPEVGALGWSADGSRLLLAAVTSHVLKIYDASASLAAHGFPADTGRQSNAATICDQIAQQPTVEFAWQEFDRELDTRRGADESEAERRLLKAAARLGMQFRFDPLDDKPPKGAALVKVWRGVELPLAVQVAEACALQQWETVLELCRGFTGEPHVAEWMALARAEALTQLSRRAEAEVSNLTAWQALRRQLSSSDSVVIAAPAPDDASSITTDLREWANIKRTDDWLGRENKNLSLLPDILEPREGITFRTGDFIQLAGKGFRISKSHLLPRATGWISLPRAATEISFALGASYIDINEPLEDTCVGSLYLLRRGGDRAVRMPLIYGRNIWDWLTPPWGNVQSAPAAAIAWTDEDSNVSDQRRSLAIYRINWTDLPGEPPVVAISFVSTVRRPAPFLISAEVGR